MKLGIGILSTANIAKRSIIPTILRMSESFNLRGIASRNEYLANEVAAQFKTTGYASYSELIESNGLDAVYIPLPNSMHYEWVKKSLESGLHVLVEKSLGCTFAEVEVLVKLADSKGLALMENFQFRFHRQFKFIVDIIQSKKYGELRATYVKFGFPPFPDAGNIRYSKDLGGGALLDAGAYTIKASQLLLGDRLNVEAAKSLFFDSSSVDIWGGGFLVDDVSGCFSNIAFGFDNFYQCGVELWFSSGKLFTNRLFTSPPGFEPTIEIETKEGRTTIKLDADNHFENMLKHFYHCCHESEKRREESKQNLNQARLLEQFRIKANGK